MKGLSISRSLASVAAAPALLVVVALLTLAACGGSGGTATSSPSTAPSVASSPTASHAIKVYENVRFMTERNTVRPPLLDVYAPTEAGPWPVVVMLVGGLESKDSYIRPWAKKVAERGAVVYVPDWIRTYDHPVTPQQLRAELKGNIGDIAAAVRFARGTAAHYGGDPGNLTLFGHCHGAMGATMEAFSGTPASKGALKGAGSTVPDRLVVFDADYLLAQEDPWDKVLKKDPAILRIYTPWHLLGRRVDFPVTVIGSGDVNLSREATDPWAKDSWFVARDASGDIRRGLEAVGAFKYGRYYNDGALQLFAKRLKEDGDTATFVALTDSSHSELSSEGMESMLDAVVPSTQP
jgi:hypothetical protein